MKKLFLILVSCFLLTGCSLVKTIISPFKPTQATLPQQTDQSKSKVICKGEYKLDETGNIIYCSKGYFNYESTFAQKERKLTLKERIVQFFDKLIGWSFWIVIGLVIFCPSVLGFIFGRIMEGIFGIGTKALKQITKAVQKVKDNSLDLKTALEASTDEDVRKFITKFKQDNNIN
jgi:hypothetical protein